MADARPATQRRGGIFLPLFFGLGGAAILVTLCVWQIQRLSWKEALVARIEARAAEAPGPLPAVPEPGAHRYLPVAVEGRFLAGEVHVLTSQRFDGPGFRIIAPFEVAGRQILVDRGFLPEAAKAASRAPGAAAISGHLDWPREADLFTPDPNLERNIWFARDVARMAGALGTEPVLLVAAQPTGDGIRPLPVTVRLPNNHLQYAITWALLAVAWLAMTALLVLRNRSETA